MAWSISAASTDEAKEAMQDRLFSFRPNLCVILTAGSPHFFLTAQVIDPDTVAGFALAGGGTNWGLSHGPGGHPCYVSIRVRLRFCLCRTMINQN